jgi:2,4-dienoyl-CoA reductase-like NADH-dependent reductase (Old Yellow Enzyme family)
VIDCSSAGIKDSATGAAKNMPRTPRVPGFQVPYAAHLRAAANIKTMAVGLIVDPKQAEAVLQEENADLIAIGREAQLNPNWPHLARLALGEDQNFDQWPQQHGWWLTRRESILKAQGIKRPSPYLMGDS